jgi:hypothetical protein
LCSRKACALDIASSPKACLKFSVCCGDSVTELKKKRHTSSRCSVLPHDEVHKHLQICQVPTSHWGIAQSCHCKWGWRKDQGQRLSVLADCSIACTARRKLIWLCTLLSDLVLWYAMLYYATLCFTILCFSILHYTLLYWAILYHTILCYTILSYTILCYTVLNHTILHYKLLCYTILYYSILFYSILYRTILYYTIPYHTIPYHIIPYYTILHWRICIQDLHSVERRTEDLISFSFYDEP